ncbi:hypothetical protein GGR54DRAFT_641184 [Hypoxylon sp. NC1633]|nr:hypothetical protein GGR54DRAFT_641184 [Hypoxylon sp. NC1633]
MDSNSAEAYAGSSSQQTPQTHPNDSTRDGPSPLESYVLDSQTHERFAIGKSSDRPEAAEELQRWDEKWEAASGSRDSS